MADAITGTCLTKIETGALPLAGLSPAEPALASALFPAGNGSVWRTADPGVVVANPDVPYACQVVGQGVSRRTLGRALRDWLTGPGSGFARDGSLPFSSRNEAGVTLVARTGDGDYLRIHVTNMAGDRVGAMLNRLPDDADTRRLLRQ